MIAVGDIAKYDNNEIIILVTGNQGEPLDALEKLVRKHHRDIKITEGDTVLFTFTPSPAMEVQMSNTMNLLAKAGATIMTASKNVHVSSHASQEDLKLMLNLMRPKYFMPVQGEYRMLIGHTKLAHQVGIPQNHIFIADKGDIVEYK